MPSILVPGKTLLHIHVKIHEVPLQPTPIPAMLQTRHALIGAGLTIEYHLVSLSSCTSCIIGSSGRERHFVNQPRFDRQSDIQKFSLQRLHTHRLLFPIIHFNSSFFVVRSQKNLHETPLRFSLSKKRRASASLVDDSHVRSARSISFPSWRASGDSSVAICILSTANKTKSQINKLKKGSLRSSNSYLYR